MNSRFRLIHLQFDCSGSLRLTITAERVRTAVAQKNIAVACLSVFTRIDKRRFFNRQAGSGPFLCKNTDRCRIGGRIVCRSTRCCGTIGKCRPGYRNGLRSGGFIVQVDRHRDAGKGAIADTNRPLSIGIDAGIRMASVFRDKRAALQADIVFALSPADINPVHVLTVFETYVDRIFGIALTPDSNPIKVFYRNGDFLIQKRAVVPILLACQTAVFVRIDFQIVLAPFP